MAVLLLLLLLIILLWKCHSRKGGKTSTDSAPFTTINAAFEVNEPMYETIADTVARETNNAELNSQHDEASSNEDYTEMYSLDNGTDGGEEIHLQQEETEDYVKIHSQHDETENIATTAEHIETHSTYKITATADPTEHTHGSEAYQTTATDISTKVNPAYGSQVGIECDYEENATYGKQVDDQDDNEEYYDEPRFQ